MERESRGRNTALLSEEEFEARRHELLAGIAQYNDGYFFEAHETWEELWYPSPWPARPFLQGLIQVAAAFVHLSRHKYPGTVRLLAEALEKLEAAPADYLGIDVARLRGEVRRARQELVDLGPERFEEWDRTHAPKIQLL